MFTRILVGTDGSDDATRAAVAAAELAEQFHSRVTLLSVYSPPTVMSPETSMTDIGEDVIREIHDVALERTSRPFERKGIPFQTRTETGWPADVIVSVAEEQTDDLIVLGSHGAGPFRRFLLGSVSDRVSHQAHCGVLIVKRENCK